MLIGHIWTMLSNSQGDSDRGMPSKGGKRHGEAKKTPLQESIINRISLSCKGYNRSACVDCQACFDKMT